MKIRASFVSNSSSSSYLVIGKIAGNVFRDDFIRKEGSKYVLFGKYLNEGIDVIVADDDILKFIKEHYDKFKYILGDIIEVVSEGDGFGTALPYAKDLMAWAVEADYNSSATLEQFCWNYDIASEPGDKEDED